MSEIDDIHKIMDSTEDAYSRGRWGDSCWEQITRFLLRQKYTNEAVEEILRSKYMRWIADWCDEQHHGLCLENFKVQFKKDEQRINDMLLATREEAMPHISHENERFTVEVVPVSKNLPLRKVVRFADEVEKLCSKYGIKSFEGQVR